MGTQIKAKDLRLGDIVPFAEAKNRPLSVKQVYLARNPSNRRMEVTIKGPLGIREKFDAEATISILNDR